MHWQQWNNQNLRFYYGTKDQIPIRYYGRHRRWTRDYSESRGKPAKEHSVTSHPWFCDRHLLLGSACCSRRLNLSQYPAAQSAPILSPHFRCNYCHRLTVDCVDRIDNNPYCPKRWLDKHLD